eukprot:3939562-Rhodomonas_salina.1
MLGGVVVDLLFEGGVDLPSIPHSQLQSMHTPIQQRATYGFVQRAVAGQPPAPPFGTECDVEAGMQNLLSNDLGL